MTAQQLLTQFRNEMLDTAKPHFWSDEEILGYMDDAYKMFVRLMGGIADFTSDLTRVDIDAGDPVGILDKRILRITEAFRVSDGGKISIINHTDLTFTRDNDYGLIRPLHLDTMPGPVRYMVIGTERGKCKWVQIPETNDAAQLYVYRLPATKIEMDGTNLDYEFDEIGDEHVPSLCLWMRHRGYMKQDADTFDPKRAESFRAAFAEYCTLAKREWDRYKHKNREIQYGGL